MQKSHADVATTPRGFNGRRLLLNGLIATLAGVTLLGCTHRLTDFTFITNKNINLGQLASLDTGPAVKGVDARHIIFLFPTGAPNMKEAIDRAIESTPGGVALANGRVRFATFYIPLLFGRHWFTATGDILVDRDRVSTYPAGRPHTVVQMNPDGTTTRWAVDAATYSKAAAAKGDRAVNRLLAGLPTPASPSAAPATAP